MMGFCRGRAFVSDLGCYGLIFWMASLDHSRVECWKPRWRGGIYWTHAGTPLSGGFRGIPMIRWSNTIGPAEGRRRCNKNWQRAAEESEWSLGSHFYKLQILAKRLRIQLSNNSFSAKQKTLSARKTLSSKHSRIITTQLNKSVFPSLLTCDVTLQAIFRSMNRWTFP